MYMMIVILAIAQQSVSEKVIVTDGENNSWEEGTSGIVSRAMINAPTSPVYVSRFVEITKQTNGFADGISRMLVRGELQKVIKGQRITILRVVNDEKYPYVECDWKSDNKQSKIYLAIEKVGDREFRFSRYSDILLQREK